LPDEIWRSFRERSLASYTKWGSHPNLPKIIPRWLAEVGFGSVHVSLQLYSAATIGAGRFEAVVLATARMFHLEHPEIWDDGFMNDLRDWLIQADTDPYITIAHIRAVKPE
jgi:hypothetical protein